MQSLARLARAIALPVAALTTVLAMATTDAGAQALVAPPPAPVVSDECPCTALVNRLAAIKDELRAVSARIAEIEREMSSIDREMKEMHDGIVDALRSGLATGGSIKSESDIGNFPPYKALAERREVLRLEWAPLLRKQMDLIFEMRPVSDRLRDCLARCGLLQPQVRIAVGGPNNPFNPRDPVGTGTAPGAPLAGSTLLFDRSSYEGGEGGVVQVRVLRSTGAGGGTARGAVSVLLTTVSGSATSGADFAPVSQTLAWADGDATPRTVGIALVDDALQEGPESFAVVLSNVTGDARLDIGVSSVTIADNDGTPPPQQAGRIQFAQSAYETSEGAGTVTITVTRTGSTEFATVRYFTGPGSATGGADYGPLNNGILEWARGDATPKTFTIAIVDDALVEGPENFFVTLNNPEGNNTLGAPATASITIQDNDQPPPAGPCGQQGNAWQPNTGAAYACSGNCSPNASSPVVSVSGDLVTVSNFHAGGAAVFQGCSTSLASQSNSLTYFGQAIHRATIVRIGNNAFSANIVASTGANCGFSCSRSGP